MFLKRFLSLGKKERKVIDGIRKHIALLCEGCWCFKAAVENRDKKTMQSINDLEREGDLIRREIISSIYEGAFLPYFRPDLCKFVEIVDSVFDLLQDAASNYLFTTLPKQIENECIQVAHLNARMCEMLSMTLDAVVDDSDFREKLLAVRIYEKKIDDLKFGLIESAQQLPVDHFWQGRMLADFIDHVTMISDIVEDASDHLEIIHVSLRA